MIEELGAWGEGRETEGSGAPRSRRFTRSAQSNVCEMIFLVNGGSLRALS